jgi:signal transduction histidine kinase
VVDAMRDRVETAGGTVTDHRAGQGTVVEVSLPAEPAGVRA